MFDALRFKNKYPLLVPFVDDVNIQKSLLKSDAFLKFYNDHLDQLQKFIDKMNRIYGHEVLDVCIDAIVDKPEMLEIFSSKLTWFISGFKELNEDMTKVSLISWNEILQNEAAGRKSMDTYIYNEKIKSVVINALFKEKTLGTPFERFYSVFVSITPCSYKERIYNLFLENSLDNLFFIADKYDLNITDYKVLENVPDKVLSDEVRQGIGNDLLYLKFFGICYKTTPTSWKKHIDKLLETKNYELIRGLLRLPERAFFTTLDNNKDISNVTEMKYHDLVAIIYYTFSGNARLDKRYYNSLYSLTKRENVEAFNETYADILRILAPLVDDRPDPKKLAEIYNEIKNTTDEERKQHAATIDVMNKEMDHYTKKEYTDLIDTGKDVLAKAEIKEITDSSGKKHNISTYTLENDEPFTFLVTIMHHLGRSAFDQNMYGRPAHKLTMDDPSNFEKDLRGGSDIISTTLINDRSIGTYVGYNPELTYAFLDVDARDVLSITPCDGGLPPDASEIKETFSRSNPENPNMFIADTLRSQDRYNEIAILRKTVGKKRLPNAIICYDEINDVSIKHAEYFNIPIILINTRTYKYLNGFTDSEKKGRY